MANFEFTPLGLPEVVLVRPPRHGDARGYFTETYREALFRENGIEARFVQDNQAGSAQAGTLRGLHFQAPPRAQAKLIRVLRGRIFDVAVDLRAQSPRYGSWCAAELGAESGEQIYVPAGFAHGYLTLEAGTEVAYKVSDYYAPEEEGGLMWNDPALGIDWPMQPDAAQLSARDRDWPAFEAFETPFRGG